MNEAEVGRFGSLFSEFLERVVHTARLAPTGAEPLVDRIESFLGSDPLGVPMPEALPMRRGWFAYGPRSRSRLTSDG